MKKHNSTFLLFTLWIFLNITDGLQIDQNNNGYEYIQETDGLYKYYDTPSTWSSAVETCERESAILFHPKDEKELITVASFYENLDNTFPKVFWLGASKSHNSFKTVTGVSITNMFNKWNDQQLDHDYQDCLEALHTPNVAWKLYSRECSKRNVFICKSPVINQNNQSMMSVNDEVLPYHHISKPDYHFVPGTNGLYKYHNTPREWETAVVVCGEEGATLFYPADENELITIIRFWHKIENGNVPERFLVDLKKAKNGFRTMSGIPISKVFNKWRYGEPNNVYGNEHCVEIVSSSANGNTDWALNDFTCWVTRKYICKIPIKQDGQSTMFNFGYRFSELLGKSYKLHLTPKNWNEARAVCQSEAADLAVINSPEEAAYLVNLAKRVNDFISGNFTHGLILMGFHRQNVENWQTVQGNALSVIKYRQPWGKRQPDRGNGEECGAMFYNGHLTDIDCSRKALFICEHVVHDLDFIVQPDIS